MCKAISQWGIELKGAEEDLNAWRIELKPSFDPFVEEIDHEQGKYLALRSDVFKMITSSEEANRVAKNLLSVLNVIMSKNADVDPLSRGAVIEFVENGRPRKHHIIEAEPIIMRLRGFPADLKMVDAQVNVIEPPPKPSEAQLWMRAATLEPELGRALSYLEGKPGWVELYKSYEAIRALPNGGISKTEMARFAQTANASERHHPSEKYKPNKNPMELWEARVFITRWIAGSINCINSHNSDSML
ncbi:hypothetical protein [Xanthobacter versatilis]|uniref:hypothetical protein n=1 Tax=Xanthobacter autotrophicus (strain ATCC BAA-1158 / Py2) TaxID=78245 RepID=UPI00372B0732